MSFKTSFSKVLNFLSNLNPSEEYLYHPRNEKEKSESNPNNEKDF